MIKHAMAGIRKTRIWRLMNSLKANDPLEHTIIALFADHGCTFRTRLGGYKRSPRDASIRVPLIFSDPGFDRSLGVSGPGIPLRAELTRRILRSDAPQPTIKLQAYFV